MSGNGGGVIGEIITPNLSRSVHAVSLHRRPSNEVEKLLCNPALRRGPEVALVMCDSRAWCAADTKEIAMRFGILIASVVLMGTITLAQSINYDFDKTANFAGFKTYAWIPGAALPDRLNNERIIA